MVSREFTVGTLDPSLRFLDLACGSGEVSNALVAAGVPLEQVLACDPFTQAGYEARLGHRPRSWSFRDIALRAIDEFTVDVVVCSYALHLCEQSWLPEVCRVLSERSRALVVITPHKRPILGDDWGWALRSEHRDAELRVRVRRYGSTNAAFCDAATPPTRS